jgi:hypothetical protein
VAEDELILAASADQAYPTEIKVEVYRTRTDTLWAQAVAAESGGFSDRRVRNIWPDTLPDAAGEEVQGYYLCAALAGLRAGSAPHAPLTNVEVSGFGIPTRSTRFTTTQLNTMAEGGTWIVTADLSGAVYTRHQLTTDNTDINRREDTITTNLDSQSRVYRENFADLIGRGNVSEDMLQLIRVRVHSISAYIMSLPYPVTIGPQLQGYEITQLYVDPALRDHVILRVAPELPYPLNNLDIYLTIA